MKYLDYKISYKKWKEPARSGLVWFLVMFGIIKWFVLLLASSKSIFIMGDDNAKSFSSIEKNNFHCLRRHHKKSRFCSFNIGRVLSSRNILFIKIYMKLLFSSKFWTSLCCMKKYLHFFYVWMLAEGIFYLI